MTPQLTSLETSRLNPSGAPQSAAPAAPAPAAPAPAAPGPVTAKPPLAEPLTDEQIFDLKEKIVQAMHTIFDPEVPVNIYELGLIYQLEIAPTGAVGVQMTLTTPACPVAGTLPGEVERKLAALANVTSVKIDLVWDPPWDKGRMSEAAKLQLGIDD